MCESTSVKCLELGVAKCRDWQWLQVEQFGVWWVFLWQKQVPEGNWQQRFTVDPTVRHDAAAAVGVIVSHVMFNDQ